MSKDMQISKHHKKYLALLTKQLLSNDIQIFVIIPIL